MTSFPSTADRFGPIVDLRKVAVALRDQLKLWCPEYLRALERQDPILEVDQTPVFRTAEVRSAGVWRKPEQTPALITWVAGIRDVEHDTDGQMYGKVDLGALIVVAARDEDAVGALLHRYVGAARANLYDLQTLGGLAAGLSLEDEDFGGVDADTNVVRAGALLSYVAHGVTLGRRSMLPLPDPTGPRDDPRPPWPIDTVETAPEHLVIDPEDPR